QMLTPSATSTAQPTATHTSPPPTGTATPTPTASLTATLAATATATTTPTSTVDPTPTSTGTATPIPRFAAHGSVEQVYVTDADPGAALQLLDTTGHTVQSGTADAQGSFIFRHVPVGRGYVVTMGSGAARQLSRPVAATDPNDPPDPSFYSNQHIIMGGYQYLT